MKTTNYKRGDDKQFSIDRTDSRLYHTDNNIQLLCWGCNCRKKDRFVYSLLKIDKPNHRRERNTDFKC